MRTRKARPKSRDLVSGGVVVRSGGVGDFGSMARRSVVGAVWGEWGL